jgi:tocopherol O-methyltransferase
MPSPPPLGLDAIIDYYDHTRYDYRVAWLNEDNLAVHFGFYDRHTHRHEEALLNTNRILAEKAAVEAGQQVLDAGCGKGGSALWLARQKGARVVGANPVQSQIEEARAQASQRSLEEQCQFLNADYCQMPLEDEQFDVVWACESLCHAPDKSQFYREAFRLLRPGGRLILAEYTRYRRQLPKAQEQLLLDWLNRWAIPDIDSAAEHEQHMHEAGFEQIKIEDYTPYAFISLKNLHQIARRWLWANHLLLALGIRKRAQHHNIVGSIRQFEALKQGLWFYGLISARKP